MKHFKAFELVDPQTYAKFGEDSFKFFRPEILYALDRLREFFDRPMIVNNWKTGGPFQWRGLRTIDCAEGAALSPHRVGAAIDFDVVGMDEDLARQMILAKPLGSFPGIRRIEDGLVASSGNRRQWTHIDCFEHDGPGIKVFQP